MKSNPTVCIGKKNRLFVGHEGSAQKAALLYSLIQSAKLNEINPRIYLHYVLTQVHALRKKEVNAIDLLPHRVDRRLLDEFAAKQSEKIKEVLTAFGR